MTDDQVHFGERLDGSAIDALAALLCGDDGPSYRKGWELTNFFQSLNIDARHDGSTRGKWTREILTSLAPPVQESVLLRLADLRE